MTVSAPERAGGVEGFRARLARFEGPLQLLLTLVESRQLDLLTVPLGELADAYVGYLAEHEVEPRNLAEFVATAAQLILLKSRRLLPEEPVAAQADDDEPDEEELRRRLVAYRAIRDAALRLGATEGVRPAFRREPRESDLPPAATDPIDVAVLARALRAVLAAPEPIAPPPEIMAREITIADQIVALRAAMADRGSAILQRVLERCRSRTEAAVTVLATLELVRRREVLIQQRAPFGPITISLRNDRGDQE